MNLSAVQKNKTATPLRCPIALSRIFSRAIVVAPMLIMLAILPGCFSADESAVPDLPVTSVSYWSMPAEGPGIPAPRSIHVSSDKKIFVLDDAGRVLVFNEQGKVRKKWFMPEYEVGRPEGICQLHDGRIVVADTHYDRLVYFDQDGKVLKIQGEHGNEPGQFAYPVAVTQDATGNIYVGEYGAIGENANQRVQKFDADGNFLLQFGASGTEPGQFQRPSGLVWVDGRIYAVDAFNNRVQVFSDEGKYQGMFGESDKSGELDYPYDIARTEDGRLFVIEHKAGRVTGYSADGQMLGRFGTPGRGKNQFLTPWGMAAFSPTRLLIADTGNRRIVELNL